MSATDAIPVDPGLAALVRLRGGPLLEALEERIPGARTHAEATGSYALAAAVGLGLHRPEAELCRETAKLHDVGKVYVPVALLARRPADLSSEERSVLDSHHEAGARLALGAGVPEVVCDWILLVRERFDGQGPGDLAGSRIPVASRVARAACACDLILSANATGSDDPASLRSAAVEELRASAGHELDPDAVEALAALLERSAS